MVFLLVAIIGPFSSDIINPWAFPCSLLQLWL